MIFADRRLPLRRLVCLPLFLAAAFCQTSTKPAATPASRKPAILWQKLESTIHDVDHHLDGVMGVAIEDLSTGEQSFLREDEVFAQASSIKIAVLADLYLQAQQGKLKLADLYTVQSSDLVADSDNSAANVLIDRIGMENVNAMLDSMGLAHTRLRRKMMDLEAAKQGRENISTPREMMMLLGSISRGKLLNKESTAEFFRVLSTNKDSWIPHDLPADVKIANKPGSLEGVRNDSGIVFVEGRPYVICVMTAFLENERDGEEAISKVSLAAWKMFDRLSRASEYGRVVSPGNGSR